MLKKRSYKIANINFRNGTKILYTRQEGKKFLTIYPSGKKFFHLKRQGFKNIKKKITPNRFKKIRN